MTLLHVARLTQTEDELKRVKHDIQSWLEGLKQSDEGLGRHRTRLQELQEVLLSAAQALEQTFPAMDLSSKIDTGELYHQCREHDQAIVWLERLWSFFKEKFDQRDDRKRLGPMLEAADEVIWSCYADVFSRVMIRAPDLKQGPPPLAFIAPEYSPAAWERGKQLPAELGLVSTLDELDEFMRSLPVPLLRLPPWCVDSPWWMIYIAHEVGHHLLYELGLKESFKKGMKKVATDKGLPIGLADRWERWSEEIFADTFSVAMMGNWAVRSVLEVEWSNPASMVNRRNLYPPAVVRLSLMAKMADELKLGGFQALAGLVPEQIVKGNAQAEQDMAMVNEVVKFALRPLDPRLGSVKDLCGLKDPPDVNALNIRIAEWAKNLRGQPQQPTRTLDLPRVVVCGALSAWEKVISIENDNERNASLNKLRGNTIGILRVSGPLGARGGELRPNLGPELAKLLLRASRQAARDDE